MPKGIIFNFQKFSIHDGPGIRTTVFFKGCPLRCVWCHNPEGIGDAPEVSSHNGQPIGRPYTTSEAMAEIRRDRRFYEESGGGVTFSGGECMSQIDFLEALAQNCKKEGINVAVDTSGHAPWSHFQRIMPYCDIFLYDIKISDPKLHEKYTGVDNRQILANLQNLSDAGAKIWLRFPIIGGINLDEGHISGLANICRTTRHEGIYLLPYHPMAEGKLEKLGMAPRDPGIKMHQPTAHQLAEIKARLNL